MAYKPTKSRFAYQVPWYRGWSHFLVCNFMKMSVDRHSFIYTLHMFCLQTLKFYTINVCRNRILGSASPKYVCHSELQCLALANTRAKMLTTTPMSTALPNGWREKKKCICIGTGNTVRMFFREFTGNTFDISHQYNWYGAWKKMHCVFVNWAIELELHDQQHRNDCLKKTPLNEVKFTADL